MKTHDGIELRLTVDLWSIFVRPEVLLPSILLGASGVWACLALPPGMLDTLLTLVAFGAAWAVSGSVDATGYGTGARWLPLGLTVSVHQLVISRLGRSVRIPHGELVWAGRDGDTLEIVTRTRFHRLWFPCPPDAWSAVDKAIAEANRLAGDRGSPEDVPAEIARNLRRGRASATER